MSTPASTSLDLLEDLPELPPRTGDDRRLRALERPAARRRPRLLYGIVAVAGAVLIGAAQMGLSILTTQSSYELAQLTSQQRSLDYQKRMLTDSIAGLSSPQYLAANASALGMVTGQTPTYLRLSDSAIIGTAAGSNGASAVNALSQAAVANALVAGVPLASDPSASLGAGASVADEAIAEAAASPATPPVIADGLPTPDTH
ncbi:MAG: hypothetical protein ABS62_05210 [Microbacterium sp. SCN 70-200]|uniref:hypothetical protein n=1 Tax=unclassified Microbacterium TaxID=2609290 RepID=UPI00086A8291|nr:MULTISPECIES: hypothetical protein [unclassified Microbacterium]MBN9215952.1 hypothetical protein [Microbacterium sp.]ODT41854.1 MAG: hypothetical protein ABS62_05210 [Microbacterium sp. SCN 70-200]OJV84543.1 MAG: hypothetical protein BGO46_06455 [Microbacterium sp. 70-16]